MSICASISPCPSICVSSTDKLDLIASDLANQAQYKRLVLGCLCAILQTIQEGKFVTQDVAMYVLLR